MTEKNGRYYLTVKAIVVKNNKCLLMKRRAYRNSPYEWDLPGGCLGIKEDPNKGILREVFEESGFEVKIKKIIEIKLSDKNNTVFITYLAVPIKGKLKLSHEHIESAWIPFDEKDIENYDNKAFMDNAKKYFKKEEKMIYY